MLPRLHFYTGLTAYSNVLLSGATTYLGIATTTPGTALSVDGNSVVTGTSTILGLVTNGIMLIKGTVHLL